MTAKAALCELLLNGKILNVKNCFTLVGLTNCAREISRMIEQPFQVDIHRTNRTGTSRYGQSVVWVDYKLKFTKENEDGILRMREYLASQKSTSESKPDVIQVIAHTRQSKKEPVPEGAPIQQKLL